jgi:hypothetical protein
MASDGTNGSAQHEPRSGHIAIVQHSCDGGARNDAVGDNKSINNNT